MSRANLLRLSRNALLPPWWKCRCGSGVEESFSCRMMKVQPSSLTVTERRSLTLKAKAQRLLSWLLLREPGDRKQGFEKTGISK